MSEPKPLDRRAFLRRASQLGIAAAITPSVLLLSACKRQQTSDGVELGKVASCDGTVKLTAEEQAQRYDLNYVETAENDKQNCANCVRFIAPDNDAPCGACGVINGPINPAGYCDDWEMLDL